MKNAQLKLTEVDDDELWLAVRLAHPCNSNSNSSSSSSKRQNQQLNQLQPRSLSTKHHINIANKQHNSQGQKPAPRAEDVATHVSSNDQQEQLDSSNMLSPKTAAAIAAGNQATTQQPTNIRLCARKRQRLRRRRKRKPATPNEAEATTALVAAAATGATLAAATTSNSNSISNSNSNNNNNLHPIATYMQCRTIENDTSIPISSHDLSPATLASMLQVLHILLASLQQWQLHVQQQAVLLLRGIAISTTAFISYLGSFAAQLRSSPSQNSSNSSSSTQIINGLNKHSWIFLLIYLNLSAKAKGLYKKEKHNVMPAFCIMEPIQRL